MFTQGAWLFNSSARSLWSVVIWRWQPSCCQSRSCGLYRWIISCRTGYSIVHMHDLFWLNREGRLLTPVIRWHSTEWGLLRLFMSLIILYWFLLLLQVLSVLTASLSPHVTKATPLWTLPQGYSLAETTPSSCLETIYSGSSCLALAFLNKTTEKSNNHMPTIMSLSGEMQEENIVTSALPSLQLYNDGSKAAQVLLKAASYLKIVSLEEEMYAGQPKLSWFNHSESLDEPATKKVRVNGMCHTSPAEENKFTTEDKLLSYSHSFGIPCVLTCLQSSPKDQTAPVVILPGNHTTQKQSQNRWFLSSC